MNRREFLAAAAAAPLVIRATPAVALRLSGTPVALVTADTESRVAAVELATGRVLRFVETLPGPRSIESVRAEAAIVAHTAHSAVSIVDGRSLRVLDVLRGFAEPRYTAARADGRYAYVTDSGRGELATLDVPRGRVVHRTELGGPARHVTLAPGGRRLWVALGSKAAEVAVVDTADPAQPRLLRRLRPPFRAHHVGYAPDGDRVWVTSGDKGGDRDLRSADAPAAAPAPRRRAAAARHLRGRLAYVTSGGDGTLRVHSQAAGRVVRTTRVPVGSYNVQQGRGWILTPSLDRGTLCVLDRRGRLVERVQVAPSSHDACFVMTA